MSRDDDPRTYSFLKDHALNTIISQTQKVLTGATWLGVVEIAELMELPVNINNRSPLGRFVKSIVGNLGKEEKRLCNGRNATIMVYPDCPEVRDAVARYFA